MLFTKAKMKFRRTSLNVAVGLAIAASMGLTVSSDANAVVAATHIYHNHMPNFWPYYNTKNYETTPVGGAIRYAYDGQVIQIKNNPDGDYTFYNPVNNSVMPHDDLITYYSHHAKQGAYKSWPITTVESNYSRFPKSATQVTMSGALVNNLQSFADLGGMLDYYNGWASGWKQAYKKTTTNGFKALDAIHFTGHHSMGPLVGPKYFLKDLIFQNVTLQQDYFLGSDFVSSKGFFPTELGFSERLIPVLQKLGVEWSVLGDIHYSRALKDYPYLDKPGTDCLSSPPNRADMQNTSNVGDWVALQKFNEQHTTFNKFPFATTPHWVQYVDPETGEVSKIAGIPVEQAGSWEEGYQGSVTPSAIMPYDGLESRPQYFVIAHDGDNSSGRAGSEDTWLASGNVTYSTPGVEGIGVNEYLKAYPIPANDVQHVQDGSWIDTGDSAGDPTWYHWHIPMGVWAEQLADFNKSHGTQYTMPTNHSGTPLKHAVSLEYGYHYLERNFALLQAAQNYAETAEQIWLDDHPNYWSPTTDAEKQVTYPGNQLNPYMYSFPVKGDAANDYKGGANPAELGWYFLIASIDSGFGYYDENEDDNVKPTLGFNQSLYFTQPYVKSNLSKDRTGPSMWWVQRYPYNPGSANASKAEGWITTYADNTFAIYTYAYDVSGIDNVKVKVRVHKDKRMSPTDIAPRVYDPVAHAGPNCDPEQVGEWITYETKKRDLTPYINGVDWQVSDNTRALEVVQAKLIGDTYYAYISDFQDQLIDYYMEATDSKGNVTKSEIQSVYVGTGVYKQSGTAMVEDINGDIPGSHMFMTDGTQVQKENVTIYAKASNQVLDSAILSYADSGSDDWKYANLKKVEGDNNVYYKGTISYVAENGCANIRVYTGGDSYFPTTDTCLSAGTYTIDQDTNSYFEGKPDDIVARSTIYFALANNPSQACVHYRSLPNEGNSGWTVAPGEAMTFDSTSGYFSHELNLADDATGIEFLFNDCKGTWYKTSSNGNYTVSDISDYTVTGTEIVQGSVDTNKAPIARISNGSTVSIDKGASITLDGSTSYDPDGSIVSYKWSNGETTSKINVSPTKETKYSLVVYDNKGAQGTASVVVSINDNNKAPTAVISSSAKAVREGSSVILDASASSDEDGSIASYKWSTGATSSKITVTPSSTTEYWVEVTDNEGKTSSRVYQTITVVKNTAPTVSINASASQVVEGTTVTLIADANDAEGDAISYKWSTGETTQSIKVTPATVGLVSYSVTATDSYGASNVANKDILVTSLYGYTQDLPALYFVGTTNSWSHQAMTYDPKTDEWFIDLTFTGKGDNKGAQRFKVTTTPNWKGVVYGAGSGNTLCSNQTTCVDVVTTVKGQYRLSVNDSSLTWTLAKLSNTAPVAVFTTDLDGYVLSTVNNSIDADGDALTYMWDFGDGSGSTEQNPTHTYASAGDYVVTLTVSDGTESNSYSETVTVSNASYTKVLPDLYYAGTTNGWTHDQMTYNSETGNWEITLTLTGSGDNNGVQRFKLTTTPNWKGSVYGTAGSNKICNNQVSCGDIKVSEVGDYVLSVNDRAMTWSLTKASNVNHAPVASFDYAKDRLVVTFANASVDTDGDAMTYAWDFGDGITSSEVHPVHAYASAGKYTVSLVASDGSSSSVVFTKVVTVEDVYIAPTKTALYYAGTTNSWGHDLMSYDSTNGTWNIELVLTGKSDSNGKQRFKVTSTADWKGTIWGNAGSNKLCSNTASCGDVFTDLVGNYVLSVNDKTMEWQLIKK